MNSTLANAFSFFKLVANFFFELIKWTKVKYSKTAIRIDGINDLRREVAKLDTMPIVFEDPQLTDVCMRLSLPLVFTIIFLNDKYRNMFDEFTNPSQMNMIKMISETIDFLFKYLWSYGLITLR